MADLGNEIAELAARLDAATHRLLECIRQFDQSDEWRAHGALSCAHWLCWRIGLDQATAREKVRVARALGQLPKIDEALRLGKLSYAKVRALTRVATAANEAQLLDLALAATGAQLERICRGFRSAMNQDRPCVPEDRTVRRHLLPGGMVKLEVVLSADEADLVMRAIDCAREASAETPASEKTGSGEGKPEVVERSEVAPEEDSAETPAWPSRPDGLVGLAESFLAGNRGGGTGGDRYQVMVHVDQDPLAPDGTLAATLEDGTGVSAETFRRIACDCGLVAVAGNDPAGMTVGRRTRSIPPAIRRALQLRDRGCSCPGCSHTRFLHGHHWRHWLHGGETSLANLLLLCPHHHRLVHEGGWTIQRGENGAWSFIALTGKDVSAETPSAWQGQIQAWLQEWSDKHSIHLGPDTNEPMWDGSPVDYDLAIGGLMGLG